MPRFYRTTITVTVLSDEPYDPPSLAAVARDIREGHCCGRWSVTSKEEVDGPTMAKMLQEQGSDPEFFMLTEEGEPIEDEQEDRINVCVFCGNEMVINGDGTSNHIVPGSGTNEIDFEQDADHTAVADGGEPIEDEERP